MDDTKNNGNGNAVRIGYARVSTTGQTYEAQVEALKAAGCEDRFIFSEKESGAKSARPELEKMIRQLQPGNIVTVTKLDRLSRSLLDTLNILDRIKKADATFEALDQSIETRTPQGRMVMNVLAIFAQFERDMIKERVAAGVERAFKQGRIGGRPKALTLDKVQDAIAKAEAGWTQIAIAKFFDVNKSVISRLLKEHRRKVEAAALPTTGNSNDNKAEVEPVQTNGNGIDNKAETKPVTFVRRGPVRLPKE